MNVKCTVYFDDPFWIGIFERADREQLAISRVVFGAEPKDYEIYAFILENYYNLVFSNPVDARGESVTERVTNPKRLQRIVRKEVSSKGIGTKAQQAVKLEYEERKLERKQVAKARREESEKLDFFRKQQKKKEKKKGH